jgi:Glycosyl transferases group 1.
LEKFRYQPEIRNRLRQAHHLENNFVVGHVGRFNTQKNHTRLLDIFAAVAKADPNARWP